jgi:hypothetical protein
VVLVGSPVVEVVLVVVLVVLVGSAVVVEVVVVLVGAAVVLVVVVSPRHAWRLGLKVSPCARWVATASGATHMNVTGFAGSPVR